MAKDAEEKSKRMERQLRAANQQLAVSEQQLKAANQQLKADEQQLRAANQQLRANEKELSKSRQRYKAMFEGSINAIAVYDAVDEGNDFVFKNFNPAAERIEKIKREDVIGKSILKVFPGVKEIGLFDTFKKVWNTGKSERFPVSLYQDQRISGWRENYIFKLPSGEIVASYEDITDRKQAEESLNVANRQLKAANQRLTADEQQLRAAHQQLTAGEQQLRAANQQLRANEKDLKQINHSLGERVQELNCLYSLSRLAERGDITLEDTFHELAELIPPGWQYPEITAARITFEGRQFETSNFRKTAWIQSADIKVHGQKSGIIEVCYLKKMPIIDEGPFMEEERSLLNALAERIGSIITRKRAEEALEAAYQQLDASNQQLRANEQQLRSANQQLAASEQQLRAANQQLKADEQQLKSANQQLTASEQQLKAANKQLQESEKRYRAIAEDIPVMICRFLPGCEITYVNEAYCRYLEKTPEELVGSSFLPLVYEADRKMVMANISALTVESPNQSHEHRVIGADGKIRWHRWTNRALFDTEGKVIDYQSVGEDITDRKEAEKKLLEYQSQLKSLASELSLAEERQRRRIAAELHDRISQSLVISKVELQSLRRSVDSVKIAKSLDKICDSLGQIIQNTRSLTFDLGSPILYELGFETAVAEWLIEQVQEKHGIATVFEDDNKPKVFDDDIRALLFRDVRELLINVVKHAKAKKVTVSIKKIDKFAQITVADDGVGFDASKLTLIPGREGGFGIFSIRERLEHLGGKIIIDSKPGHGSKITLTVPLKQ